MFFMSVQSGGAVLFLCRSPIWIVRQWKDVFSKPPAVRDCPSKQTDFDFAQGWFSAGRTKGFRFPPFARKKRRMGHLAQSKIID
jgi:hypothetical protein